MIALAVVDVAVLLWVGWVAVQRWASRRLDRVRREWEESGD